MNQIKINEIDLTASYQGYIWLSDASKPIVLNNEKIEKVLVDNEEIDLTPFFENNINPFIIEGQLFDEKNKRSFSIKNVDGEMIVVEYDESDLKVDRDSKSYEFVPNSRMGLGDRKLKFLQKWEVELNADRENMDVLVPAGLVFLGFTD
jgi:CRISPR type III-associated protein (TIGR04423 family)